MDNNYFTNVGSYMLPTDPNELAKLNPSFQNIGTQQANQNNAMQQANQLTQQAGQTAQGNGMNPMAMAMALRGNKKPETGADASKMNEFGAYMPWNQMSASSQYGTDPYSQQSRMLASQDLGMK